MEKTSKKKAWDSEEEEVKEWKNDKKKRKS